MIPSTVAQAVSAARSGALGRVEDIMIGDILVSALVGVFAPSVTEYTRKPVQYGYELTDAGVKQPQELSLDIVLADPDYSVESGIDAAMRGSVRSLLETWRDKKDKLYNIFETQEIISVQTHEELYSSMVIEVIDPLWDVEENYDAFFANVTLIEVRQVGNPIGEGLKEASKKVKSAL